MVKKFCRKLTKAVVMAGAALMLSNVFGAVQSLAADADSGDWKNSRGNIVLEQDGTTDKVAIYANDFNVIKNRIDTLMGEIK